VTEQEKIELRKKWNEWIEKIGSDLGDLLTDQDIFNELCKIVDSNRRIRSQSAYFGWLRDNYVNSVVVRIVRLNDHDNRTVSLHNLIKEIAKSPEAITRNYFVSGYPKWMQDIGAAGCDFDEFSEPGDQHVSTDKLNTHITLLDKKTALITTFRNQWIAHWDKNREIDRLPTFNDVEEAIRVIDNIFCKYYLLLKGAGLTTRKPALQFDWKEPLRYPWIDMTEEEKDGK
jgi:hypothetical protein